MFPKLLHSFATSRWYPANYLASLAERRTKQVVISGPFKGMIFNARVWNGVYNTRPWGGVYLAQLLGHYERELHPWIEEICSLQPGLIVDIGAAEGYYAVGLARRCPKTRVVTFEMSDEARNDMVTACQRNGVTGQVTANAKCDPAVLQSVLASAVGSTAPAVIICDVEGYEYRLLDPLRLPELTNSYLLVEVHDHLLPDIGDELVARFRATHAIATVWSEERQATDYPYETWYTKLCPAWYRARAVSDRRPCRMRWLWMRPSGPTGAELGSPRSSRT